MRDNQCMRTILTAALFAVVLTFTLMVGCKNPMDDLDPKLPSITVTVPSTAP